MAVPSHPFDPTNPSHLSPGQRLDELGSLLAAGYRRLMRRRSKTAISAPSEGPPESTPPMLAVSPERSVHGPVPVNAPESAMDLNTRSWR